jgi:hypothetical protein
MVLSLGSGSIGLVGSNGGQILTRGTVRNRVFEVSAIFTVYVVSAVHITTVSSPSAWQSDARSQANTKGDKEVKHLGWWEGRKQIDPLGTLFNNSP